MGIPKTHKYCCKIDDPPFEHIQRHSSSSQEVSDSSFLTNSASQEASSFSSNPTDPPFDHIKCHSSQEVTADSSFLVNSALHSHITQQEASGSSAGLNPNLSLNLLQVYSSREAPNPPSIINATSNDSSFDVLGSLGELPSKPNVPSELSMNFGFVLDLEIFDTRSQRLFDEQKKSLEFTKMYIDVLVNQCIDLRAISRLRHDVQKLEHCCPFCNDLAWNPHMCISAKRQQFVVTGRIFQCPVCWFPVCRKPIPSILLQSVVERIATDLAIVTPPLHSVAWPERC
ncbi:hypothetical protein F5876DRAFT_70992 [Lentinula aff. lateritia]|uniref:Uncharacterized protein n=1 Tax=Lentinula aff. lateritia TaxID=2804960 RepID=A0ACC1TH87_9AGAR|nr:hypothetical protein F5876DRAFT_70992 [Lentinula aff. lateritia]